MVGRTSARDPQVALWSLIYTPDTKFLYGHSNNNKPGSVDQAKQGYYVSRSGTYEAGKVQMNAKECVYRETK